MFGYIKILLELIKLSVILFLIAICNTVNADPVITIFNKDHEKILTTMSEDVNIEESFSEAREIAEKLQKTVDIIGPAAGLAAPQIGINKRVFIYTIDKNKMEVAVNPKILEKSVDHKSRWEACFSSVQENGKSYATLVSRPTSIVVEYYNIEGKKVRKILNNFATTVFQHETDHLDGVIISNDIKNKVKDFNGTKELGKFFKMQKQPIVYSKPIDLSI